MKKSKDLQQRSLRLLGKNRDQSFVPKTDLSKRINIHRRKKKFNGVEGRSQEKRDSDEILFEESSDSEIENTPDKPTSPKINTDVNDFVLLKGQKAYERIKRRKLEEKIQTDKEIRIARLRKRALLKQKLLRMEMLKEKEKVEEVGNQIVTSRDNQESKKSPEKVTVKVKPLVPVIAEGPLEEIEESEQEELIELPTLQYVAVKKRDSSMQLVSDGAEANSKLSTHNQVIKIIDGQIEMANLLNNAKSSVYGLALDVGLIPDDSDGLDEQKEYEAWRLRELRRLKEYYEEEHSMELAMVETERRRNMNEEELLADNRALEKAGERTVAQAKADMQFLQRYYHKGAFFVDESTMQKYEAKSGKMDPRRKAYLEATGDDRKNMENLPAFMQRRNFGKKAQSKWTHLSNEDTTKGDNLRKEANRMSKR